MNNYSSFTNFDLEIILKAFTILILVLFFNFVLAKESTFEDKKKLLILEEIQNAIESDFKLEGEIKKVIIAPTVTKNDSETKPARPSAGNTKIQEMLEKNRQKLKERQLDEKKNKRATMMAKSPSKSANSNEDWIDSKITQVENWETIKQKEIENWQEEKKKIITKWLEEKGKYVKRIPEYKKNLPPIPKNETAPPTSTPIVAQKIATPTIQEVKLPVFEDFYIIENAFFAETKDQGKRPTCASFAGIRAIEIILSRSNFNKRLSEQYFFWASKPKCQNSPCGQEGSWVLAEYQKSQKATSPDIPTETDCPYKASGDINNVTQTPLTSGCYNGHAKVVSFSSVENSADIITALKNNRPVVAGFKLSESFYNNNGHVFINNPNGKKASLDSHAEGHALLLVGYMKLPPKLHAEEGSFCLITANSWGVGWGKGGHACLSENWIKKYRYEMPFIALEKASAL